MSHISPTLSLPGFTGFPSKNNPQVAYGEGETRPSPYGDLSLDILSAPTLVPPTLTTGRVMRAGKPAPKSDVFDYSISRESPGTFKQSVPSSQSGFGNTEGIPNPDPFPVMIGMLDAQITAMKQEEAERRAMVGDLGARVQASEIKERLKSPAELYFEAERAKVDQKQLTRLQAAGYTDEEIASFISQRRMDAMAAAAVREEPEEALRDALSMLEARMPVTGTGAVGIGPLSAARERADGVPQTTKQALRASASARGTGGSVAALKLGPDDPRAALSTAARQENPDDFVAGPSMRPLTKKQLMAARKAEQKAENVAQRAEMKAAKAASKAQAAKPAPVRLSADIRQMLGIKEAKE